jgi:mono/diheme cytochrome c family protein
VLVLLVLPLRACYGEGNGAPPTSKRLRGSADAGSNGHSSAAIEAGVADAASSTPPESGAAAPPPVTDRLLLGVCVAASTTEPVPARQALLSSGPQAPSLLFVRDLFDRFKQNCGGCHVDDKYGGFHVGQTTFVEDMKTEDARMESDGTPHGSLARIYSMDPDKIMPPDSKPVADRDPAADPTLLLGASLKAWYDQGTPKDFYTPPEAASGGQTYKMAEAVGMGLTNLGNCIPERNLVGIRPAEQLEKLDAMFAAATSLPARLEDTDVTTFDSEVLAQSGVVAYAPTYPLWSDNARKIRYVRVPRGKSIQFDKTTQSFEIPENTRFYKTFLKKVVELDGSERYRKVETRIIVTRTPTKDAQGHDVQTALFGSYAWSDDEHEATLVQDPLRNGLPFSDRLLTLHADERKYRQITQAHADGGASTDLTRDLERAGAIRRYAIPGSERCMQCHMGSPTRSFSLGFLPLQVKRRPLGQGGVIEEPGRDELTQLERLIDYGVVTGIDGPDDILPLEQSEGARQPRNDYELIAQGYMLGNCAHCHNPLGYPSVQNPDTLQGTLSFLPGTGPIDGIFQFPLEKFSPRIFRDLGGSVRIPYITPSLVDYPSRAVQAKQVAHDPTELGGPDGPAVQASRMVLAPWRSLIYRNVDTPFAYADDLALFPHMPMNAPGFDCRAPRIMAEWMLSIPSTRKHPEIDESLVQNPSAQNGGVHTNTGADTEEQPYEEIAPADSRYDSAKSGAAHRLDGYHRGGPASVSATLNDIGRYTYCPDTTDIVDWTVTLADHAHLAPADLKVKTKSNGSHDPLQEVYNIPVDFQANTGTQFTGEYDELGRRVPHDADLVFPDEGVPDRPHWVPTDTTDNPGPWAPRRSDWKTVLVDHKDDPNKTPDELKHEKWVVEFLNPAAPGATGVSLTQAIRDYASKDIPYGLWAKKPNCSYANQKHVSDFAGPSRPMWMDERKLAQDDASPVYSELPGAAVFNMVCVNCHGPLANSHGRQADTLQLMTGGDARVANFRDGLFGPVSNPGANRGAAFTVEGSAVGSDDWAARYVAWMALGGTSKLIPKAILDVVTATPILGEPRKLPGVDGANMLGPVQTLCAQLFLQSIWLQKIVGQPTEPELSILELTLTVSEIHEGTPEQPGPFGNFLWDSLKRLQDGQIIYDNGDAELWARLCSIDNPTPIASLTLPSARGEQIRVRFHPVSELNAGAPIGNERGNVDDHGYQPNNLMPWCVVPSKIQATQTLINSLHTVDDKPLPLCPPEWSSPDSGMTQLEMRKWSYRGAINGGLAVFLYVDKLIRGFTPVPSYSRCEDLTP